MVVKVPLWDSQPVLLGPAGGKRPPPARAARERPGRAGVTGRPTASVPRLQSRIIDKWVFDEDCISSPQDRSRFASFRALCYFGAGLNTENAALLFNVSKNTIENWQAIDQAPAYVWRTVLALAGQLEAIDRTWRGWFLQKGQLYAPDVADGFEPNTIRSLPMMKAAIDLYQKGEAGPSLASHARRRAGTKTGSAATASEGEVREGGRSIRGQGLRAAPMQESPAPSVLLEDSHGWEPTGRGPELEELHQGVEGSSGIGHEGTPGSDITTTSSAGKVISRQYREKGKRDQRLTAKTLDKPQQQSKSTITLFGYRVKPSRGAAPLASSRLRPPPAIKSEKIQSRIIDIMLNKMRQSSVRVDCSWRGRESGQNGSLGGFIRSGPGQQALCHLFILPAPRRARRGP